MAQIDQVARDATSSGLDICTNHYLSGAIAIMQTHQSFYTVHIEDASNIISENIIAPVPFVT